jgi:hypothetical protein
MILLTEWTFFGRAGMRRVIGRAVPFGLVLLVIPALWVLWPVQGADPAASWVNQMIARVTTAVSHPAEGADISPRDYFLTQLTVLPHYLRLVLIPTGFNIDHEVMVQTGFSRSVAIGGSILVALFALGMWAVRQWPVLGFGILWFFVTSSVESSFIPIRDLMSEHRMYLAMPGIALALATVFVWTSSRLPRTAVFFGVAVVAVGLAALTFSRNQIWRTQQSLWADALRKSPGKARVHLNFATATHVAGDLSLAIEHYCKALDIDPTNRVARGNLDLAQMERAEAGDETMVVSQEKGGMVIVVPRNPCRPNEQVGENGEGEG